MQLLFVHADHLEFEAVTAAGEDLAETDAPMEGRMDECVVVFVTVERGDEADPVAVVQNGAAEVRDVADQLNTRKVVLYPSAHLSDDLAAPDRATAVLRDLRAELDADFEVLRAPFGWYKAFDLAAKGHPLAELSRRVTPERGGDDHDAAERAPSEWKLAFPDGEIAALSEDAAATIDAEYDDRVSDALRALVAAEAGDETNGESEDGRSARDDRPSHVELAREQELADYDDRGDAGILRWYPRGALVRDGLAEYVHDRVVEYGAMPVEASATGDFETGVGPLGVVRDAVVSECDLPLRLYDRSGAEMHAATRDVAQAKAELRAQAVLARQIGEDLGLDYAPVVRLTEEFYDDEAWVESLVSDLGTPALVEIVSERDRRWSVEVALAAVGAPDGPIETATVRLDAESAERFDVTYTPDDEDSTDEKPRHPAIVHCSPAGGIEGVLAALLERAAQLDPPRLPTWLSPTQVRFVPVGEEHVEHCEALAADLESAGVRADVDDRDAIVGERIARAESDWVPYYAAVGDRELESDEDALKVTVRAEGEEREMTVETLRETVLDDVGDLPKTGRFLPKRVSQHPDFAGR